MSIDLSKAKVGDKFRAREGRILLYDGEDFENRDDKYKLIDEKGYVKHFFQYGEYLYNEESYLDLVEQVFDNEKDTTNLEVADAMNEAVKKITEEAAEREKELQRRQEVVKVANELFTRGTMKDWYCELIKHGKTKKTYLEWIFGWAENFVYTREKYLKEGKL